MCLLFRPGRVAETDARTDVKPPSADVWFPLAFQRLGGSNEGWRRGVEGWRNEGVRREGERGEKREYTTELAGIQKEVQKTKSGSEKREKL